MTVGEGLVMPVWGCSKADLGGIPRLGYIPLFKTKLKIKLLTEGM